MERRLEIAIISLMMCSSMLKGMLIGYQYKTKKVDAEKRKLRKEYLNIKNKYKHLDE